MDGEEVKTYLITLRPTKRLCRKLKTTARKYIRVFTDLLLAHSLPDFFVIEEEGETVGAHYHGVVKGTRESIKQEIESAHRLVCEFYGQDKACRGISSLLRPIGKTQKDLCEVMYYINEQDGFTIRDDENFFGSIVFFNECMDVIYNNL